MLGGCFVTFKCLPCGWVFPVRGLWLCVVRCGCMLLLFDLVVDLIAWTFVCCLLLLLLVGLLVGWIPLCIAFVWVWCCVWLCGWGGWALVLC